MSLEQSDGAGRHGQDGDAFAESFAERQTDHPVVGLPVDGTTSADAVAATILRARRNGLPVVVAHVAVPGHEAIAFADQLGVPVVDVDRFADAGAQPREVVATLARDVGFPAVVWPPEPAERIDFERTLDGLADRDSYVIEPAVESDVQPGTDVLVGIPAYDEADTIGDVVREARRYADDVLVVDDGSEDRTVAEAREAGATVIEHGENRGYGAALKTTFTEADRCGARHLVVLDGDGQHDPADVPKLVETQRTSDAELVIGSRFVGDGESNVPRYRRLGLVAVNTLTNLSFGVLRPRSWVNDTQSGFRAYDREAIRSLAADGSIGSHMGASTDILDHAHGNDFDVEEVGTTVRYDVSNASSRNPVRHGILLIMNLIQTIERRRPISALGIPGFVSALLGLGFGYWTISTYIQHGVFPIGLALTSAVFGLAGIFAAFTAIILHSLNTQLADQ